MILFIKVILEMGLIPGVLLRSIKKILNEEVRPAGYSPLTVSGFAFGRVSEDKVSIYY